MDIFWFLLVGLIAGWLAGKVMKGGSYGLVGDLVIGVIGALVGGFLFDFLGITFGGLIGAIITAFIGAVVFIYLLR
ncbi:MAG: GlsB/YeaQ/YmgE family stress response membrane protein, partial [Anaerolineae bacterium]|nr:GlsB/YeaQ/YmgE family stress response membrane protein [Anaerolineae bacterium]